MAEAAGDRWGACFALHSLSLLALRLGDAKRASGFAQDSLIKAVEFGNTRGRTLALEALACTYVSSMR